VTKTPVDELRTVTVKFEVQNGGTWGLDCTRGIVSTQDDTYLVHDGDDFANDFTIGITVPASDQYLNIRWEAIPESSRVVPTYLKAKMYVGGAGNYIIGLDYNGGGSVATANLYDVSIVQNWNGHEGHTDYNSDWNHAYNNSIPD